MENTEEKANICPRCQGSGQCRECQGSGRATCPVCNGSGQASSNKGKDRPCRTCQGQGTIECDPKCSSCGGTGRITVQMQQMVRQKYATPKDSRQSKRTATLSIIIVTCIVYLFCPSDLPSVLPDPLSYLLKLFLLNNANSLSQWQLWRFFTPALLHGSILHLACNMYFLWLVGPAIEGLLGSRRFLVLYILSALGGNFLSWLFNPIPGLGASTALYGLAAAAAVFHYRWGIFSASYIKQMVIILIALIIFGFLVGFSLGFGFDNWGHIGGALAGIMVAWSMGNPLLEK